MFIILQFSVPGIAERLAFKSLDQSTVFFLFNKRNKDLVELFLNNNLGGPALIFSRFAEAGKIKTTFTKNKIFNNFKTLTIIGSYVVCGE